MSAINMIAVQDMADYLRIPSESVDEIMNRNLTAAIEDATSTIEELTNRQLVLRTHVQTFDGRRSNRLLVREYPLTDIVMVRIDSEDIADRCRIEDEQTIVCESLFPLGTQNIEVVYDAGYAPIPGTLKRACRILAGWFLKLEETGTVGRTKSSKGDESVDTPNHIPKVVHELIGPFVRQEFPVGDRAIGSI